MSVVRGGIKKPSMDTYERNLQRLRKAEKLIDMAVHSGALVDRNWNEPLNVSSQYAWACLACLKLAIANQENYLKGQERR